MLAMAIADSGPQGHPGAVLPGRTLPDPVLGHDSRSDPDVVLARDPVVEHSLRPFGGRTGQWSLTRCRCERGRSRCSEVASAAVVGAPVSAASGSSPVVQPAVRAATRTRPAIPGVGDCRFMVRIS